MMRPSLLIVMYEAIDQRPSARTASQYLYCGRVFPMKNGAAEPALPKEPSGIFSSGDRDRRAAGGGKPADCSTEKLN
jgi:hypothetical protein